MAHITRIYTLSSDTLAAGETGIDIFEAGPTDLQIKFDGIGHTAYQYLKFIVDYGDGSNIEIVQNTESIYGADTDVSTLSSKSVTHTFYPGKNYLRTYTIGISGIRADLELDRYHLNMSIGKRNVKKYKDLNFYFLILYKSLYYKLFKNKMKMS